MLDGGRQEPGGLDPKPFDGVRFVLLGFDYDTQSEVRLKLVSGGAEDTGSYSPDCTHVIVDKCVYDDPTCVAARSDGTIVSIRDTILCAFDDDCGVCETYNNGWFDGCSVLKATGCKQGYTSYML